MFAMSGDGKASELKYHKSLQPFFEALTPPAGTIRIRTGYALFVVSHGREHLSRRVVIRYNESSGQGSMNSPAGDSATMV